MSADYCMFCGFSFDAHTHGDLVRCHRHHGGHLEAEIKRLREENDAMRAYLGAPHDDWLYLAREWNRLRAERELWEGEAAKFAGHVERLMAAIEKLREEVEASPLRESFVARRLTEILEGES